LLFGGVSAILKSSLTVQRGCGPFERLTQVLIEMLTWVAAEAILMLSFYRREWQMDHSSQDDANEKNELPEKAQVRAEQADQACGEACGEAGVKVSSWLKFDAWQDYVEGEINEDTLTDKAQKELREFAKSFGKYLVIAREDPSASDDAARKERVKRANRIYRKLCDATGLTFCFLSDFATWSDYVEGKISELELMEKAKLEIEKMVSDAAKEVTT
jgi:hypothetical protein